MKNKLTKTLASGVVLMGVTHIAATFTPLIGGLISDLGENARNVMTYNSIMCGALLIVCGALVIMLTDKTRQHRFLRLPYNLTLLALLVDGVAAISFMPHNPFACAVFIIIVLLILCDVVIKTIENRL